MARQRRGSGGGRRRGGGGGRPAVIVEIPEGAIAPRESEALPEVAYLDRLTPAREAQLRAFCDEQGLPLRDLNLLNRALSHRSYTNEVGLPHNEQNEKLEFFGDGVLGLLVNEYLFRRFPDAEEGDLAKTKSAVVSEATLAGIAGRIGLQRFILLGRGEEASGGRYRAGLLADCLEAVIGAVYIDAGLDAARRFVVRHVGPEIERVSSAEGTADWKSLLQERAQRDLRTRPSYRLVSERGPEHAKEFRVEVVVAGRRATGTGRSKKEAEQAAAESLYRQICAEGGRERAERGGPARPRPDEAAEPTPLPEAAEESPPPAEGETPVGEPAVAPAEAGPPKKKRRRRGRRGGRRRRRRR